MLQFELWKRWLVAIICFLAVIIALPNFTNFKHVKFLPSSKINLGLDLRGGSQLLLKLDFKSYLDDQLELLLAEIRTSLSKNKVGYVNLKVSDKKVSFSLRTEEDFKKLNNLFSSINNTIDINNDEGIIKVSYKESFLGELKNNVIAQSIEIVRRRIDETGMKEPLIQRQGEEYILLQVPGLANPDHLKKMLGKTAKLTFHLVEDFLNKKHDIKNLPSYLEFLPYEKSQDDSTGFVVKKKISISGDLLTNATTIFAEHNKPAVSITFNNLGARNFSELTGENVGKALAIVLDKKIISIATIKEKIAGGSSIISGNFTIESANELALLLRAGALPAPISIEEERVVGPSLGSDSIDAGLHTALISVIIVISFMVITYGIFGIFASIALSINLIFIIALLSLLQASLTMPGIAGIILTMGMAVDANVLIFERIREELKYGTNNILAIDKGFNSAFTTILDSNITTLIVAFFLYIFASAGVKGFAITLTIGIICSMFSAITITKLIIILWLEKRKSSKIIL